MINASPAMDAAIDAPVQRPRFRVLVYDVSQAEGTSWSEVIHGTAPGEDLTAYVESIQWSYEKVTVALSDDLFRFHPDQGDLRCTIAPGKALRVLEGRDGVPEDEWIPIFTGIIQGPYSWSISRGQHPRATVNAFSRESDQTWQHRFITSREYSIGADWGQMFFNIAHDIMGLGVEELAIPVSWGLAFDKTSNQIVNMPPWEALTQLAQGQYQRLWFNGKGELAWFPFTLDRVDRVYEDNTLLTDYQQPGNNAEPVNKVVVTYLDNQLTKVPGERTSLGTANLTAGFFDFETKIPIFYSEDRRQRAENVQLVVQKSINQNDLGISVGSEHLRIDNEFGGELVVRVDAWVSALATAGIAGILASAAIPDTVQVGLSGTGITFPVGRIVNAAATIAVLLAMMILGNGVYDIVGTPYDYAYLEKQAIAMLDDLPFWEEVQKEIRNDFISTEEHANQLAINELLWEQSLGKPRSLVLPNDPRIEKGDMLQLPNGSKFFVLEASKAMNRGGITNLTLKGFKSLV